MISLPKRIELKCTACKRSFGIGAQDLDGLEDIGCPFCGERQPLLEMLPATLKLQLYRELRESLENLALDSLNGSGNGDRNRK